MVNSGICDGEHVVRGVVEGSGGVVERRGGGGGQWIGALELNRASRRKEARVVAYEDSVVGVQSLGEGGAAVDEVVVRWGEGKRGGDEREEGDVERESGGRDVFCVRHWSQLGLESLCLDFSAGLLVGNYYITETRGPTEE